MKVNFSLEMKPKEFTELIEIMGMPPVVGQLDTPSMLDAFMAQVAGANAEESNPCAIADDAQSATDKASMEQAAGENDDESSPCATADDAQGATDKASGDAESAEETAINNRGKKILAEDSEAATASGCDCDRTLLIRMKIRLMMSRPTMDCACPLSRSTIPTPARMSPFTRRSILLRVNLSAVGPIRSSRMVRRSRKKKSTLSRSGDRMAFMATSLSRACSATSRRLGLRGLFLWQNVIIS